MAAPATTTGEQELPDAELERRAVAYAEANVPYFDEASYLVTRRDHITRGSGEALLALVFRLNQDGRPGSAIVTADVDRRTGAIVDFSAARTNPATTQFRVSREAAINAAQQVVGTGTVRSASADIWDRPRWTVEIEGTPTPPFTTIHSVVVDANSGRVVDHFVADK